MGREHDNPCAAPWGADELEEMILPEARAIMQAHVAAPMGEEWAATVEHAGRMVELAARCPHDARKAQVIVNRLTDEAGAVTGWTSDIRVWCDHCGLPFRFLGLPAGVLPDKPTVSYEATELRAPIAPGAWHAPFVTDADLSPGEPAAVDLAAAAGALPGGERKLHLGEGA